MAKKRETAAETPAEPDVATEKPAQDQAGAAEHDAIGENPAAPASAEPAITTTAPWHNEAGTGAYTEPEVTTVRAYDQPAEGGPVVAKVLEAPARPRATRGRQASAAGPEPAEETESEENADGEDVDGEAE